MSKFPNKSKQAEEIEEGELPDDEPARPISLHQASTQKELEESSPSSQIIFETVTDSELQSEKKKKKIYKEQRPKKSASGNPKEKERGYEKDKKSEKSNAPKFTQQREISPSFNYPNMASPNPLLKPQNSYMPPHMQQFYPPQFGYPMMPHPVTVSAPYPPYMPSYMHPNMPQPYPYNMGPMQMQQNPMQMQQNPMQMQQNPMQMQQNPMQMQQNPMQMQQNPMQIQPNPMQMQPSALMNNKPNIHQAYAAQMNSQMSNSHSAQMGAQMSTQQMGNPMAPMNASNAYMVNQKPKTPVNNGDFYQNQYKGNNNQRDWNMEKSEPKPSSQINFRQFETQQQIDNLKQRNRGSVDRYERTERTERADRYEKADKIEKEQKNSEAAKKKAAQEEFKSQLRKHLKTFEAQQQLQILQLTQCLTKQSRVFPKEPKESSRKNHQKIVNQLEAITSQSDQKKENVYRILQILQFECAQMELKEKVVLNWLMKDQQFVKMSELSRSILESPLKI